VLGEEHPDTLTSMANLALTFWNQGRWKEAEELQAQAAEGYTKIYGLQHPHTKTVISSLANMRYDRQRSSS
ncbi:hypothetical protein K431DRAFT_236821, partial [Polychaeton citri CBS 116435]